MLSLILICLVVWCNTQAQYQQKTFTHSYHDATIKSVFDDLRKFFKVQFTGNFCYDNVTRTNLDLNDVTLEEALTKLLLPFRYQFTQYVTTYCITPLDETIPFLSGTVRNPAGKGLENIDIAIAGTKTITTTNSEGRFRFRNVPANATLHFSSINTITLTKNVAGNTYLAITLEPAIELLNEHIVQAKAHNGYYAPRQIEPGPLKNVDFTSKKDDRITATITGRLANALTGLSFQQDNLQIRTPSTIHANRRPLVVLDGIPYDGGINSFQPSEIQNITVLKNGVAVAPWGIRACNGVIIIERKKSQLKQPFRTHFSSTILFTPKVDLYKDPSRLTSAQSVEVESFLFDQGHYTQALNDPRKPGSPVAQIKHDHITGRISRARADYMLDSLLGNDVLKELSAYYYRPDLTTQYALNVSSSDANNAYHLFTGYNTTTTGRVRNGREQFTISVDHVHVFNNPAFELRTDVRVDMQKEQNNNMADPGEAYSYSRLADDNGNALPVTKDHKASYLARPEMGRLLNWEYKPLDELRLADNVSKNLHLMADAELRYTFNNQLSAKAYTRVERKVTSVRNFRSIDSWFTRNLINQYTQINGTTITHGVPRGNILDKADQQYRSENLGIQVKYLKQWDTTKGSSQQLHVIVGGDIKMNNTKITENREYGYDPQQRTSIIPNFTTTYLLYGTMTPARVPDLRYAELLNENFISAYVLANYTYRNQFSITGSLRQDHTNMFGTAMNDRFIALYSTGVGWEISNSAFLPFKIPYLKVSVTRGISGNMYRPLTNEPTILLTTDYQTNQSIAIPVTPANPDLRYEKSIMTSFSVDAEPFKNLLSISAEYFFKKGTDLFGKLRTDPGTGFRDVMGNYAEMKGKGLELTVSLTRKWRALNWKSELGYNYLVDKITRYNGSPTTVGDHLSINQPIPLEGYSLNTVFSTKTTGLDKNTGQLQSVPYSGAANDFNAILHSTDLPRYLNAEGTSVPGCFGYINNTVSWKGLTVQAIVNYKLKYVFRKTSINYDQLFNNRAGHKDLSARWKHSGDESATVVPAMIYPSSEAAGVYYEGSDVLIGKGDHIRLQDLVVSWSVLKKMQSWLPCKQLLLTSGVSNVCILYRANRSGIDPDNPLGYSLPRTYMIKLQIFL